MTGGEEARARSTAARIRLLDKQIVELSEERNELAAELNAYYARQLRRLQAASPVLANHQIVLLTDPSEKA